MTDYDSLQADIERAKANGWGLDQPLRSRWPSPEVTDNLQLARYWLNQCDSEKYALTYALLDIAESARKIVAHLDRQAGAQ